ncbi:DUF4198 domain-containing protein [uncultured Roseovarius sp.]|uniref:DUF4198 domain-containing protein n=1 Tax=uncultured Roseovarius sp. TaxID=293344 RepID=UPI00261D97C1|nr:DUF4198 domain-containing protein [uncultured Roseovarius sp.]
MLRMIPRFLIAVLALLVACPFSVGAHEFWIDPIDHILSPGDTLEANLKVGQNYAGAVYPLLPGRLTQFSVSGPKGTNDITGTVGDVPAARLPEISTGLHILAYESTTDRLKFDDWELFNTYVAYEGNDWAVAAHLRAGLPKTGFTEGYRRYAKSLVQVGEPQTGDADRRIGLAIELVALVSPYLLAPDQQELPVQLLWQGAPLAQQQINVFHNSKTTTLSAVTTDQDGRAMVPVTKGGRYLLNAVHMVLNNTDTDLAWDSHWASLTFEISARDSH